MSRRAALLGPGLTLITVVLPLAAMTLGGCGKPRYEFKHPKFMSEADCATCLRVALEDKSPDVQREAIVRVSKTPHLTNEVVIRALATLARADQSESVRYAAVRALAKAGTTGAIKPLTEIASAPDDTEIVTEPRSGEVRRAALDGLDPLLASDRLSQEQRATCRKTAIHLLEHNRSRDVRIAAARVLRHFPTNAVLTTLIDALDQRDFGVVYQSERSLMHLTGQTFDHAADAWRRWRAETDDPFKTAGRLDHVLYPEEESLWKRTVKETRQTFAGFKPK